MDRTIRLKINREIEDLKNTINQLDLTDIYKTLHPTIAEYTFISSAHEAVARIDYVLGHRTKLNKFKRV